MAKRWPARSPFGRRTAVVATAVTVLAVVLTLGGLDATGHLPGGVFSDARSTPTASPTASPTPPPAAAVLLPATGVADQATPAAIDPRLLDDRALGADPGAFVVDVRTGAVLLDHDAVRARTPASVAKLATAAAALVALGPERTLTTRTVAGSSPGAVVLVGGGDTTLTVAKPGPSEFPRLASLTSLADATAASLRATGVTTASVSVDDALFEGPAVSPDWERTYVSSGVVSPVSALTLDAGRLRPRSDRRAADPALRAGAELARLLAARGIAVTGPVTRATAAPSARVLASVASPDVATLVERALSTSDNDLAEALARLVAVARSQPATFQGATTAVGDVLTELGVPTDGLTLLDGSGLARGSRIAPETLGRLLSLAAGGQDARLRPLVTGLPVAGFSGTLADRFAAASTRPAAGVVRAKTGTLTGVASLAGIGVTGTGQSARVVAFALLSDGVRAPDTIAARRTLDRIAASLVAQSGVR